MIFAAPMLQQVQQRNNVFLCEHENVERLSVLSEDGKQGNVRERILEAARNERNGLLIILMGVFLANAGLIIIAIGSNAVAYAGGFFMALGILSTLFGFYVSVHYANQYNNLLQRIGHNEEMK